MLYTVSSFFIFSFFIFTTDVPPSFSLCVPTLLTAHFHHPMAIFFWWKLALELFKEFKT